MLAGAGLLGGLGSAARYVIERAVSERVERRFPYGTLIVNVSGSFALGLAVGAGLDGDALRLVGVGLLGGYTTFSAWMVESRALEDSGRRGQAVANVLVSLAMGLAAVWLGRELGLAL